MEHISIQYFVWINEIESEVDDGAKEINWVL